MSLTALIINCTLKPANEESNTQALIDKAVGFYNKEGVATEVIRLVDYNIKPGTSSAMGEGDEWPQVLKKIKACDILIVASPVWVGHLSSIGQRFIERMDAVFREEDLWDPESGRYFTYSKVAGALVTGNEDGGHEVTGHLLWALQELGFTVPPNSNAYWVGEAGPGPSYIEAGGERHLFTNKTLLFTVYNTVFFAKLLKEHPMTTNLKELNEKAQKMSDSEEESSGTQA